MPDKWQKMTIEQQALVIAVEGLCKDTISGGRTFEEFAKWLEANNKKVQELKHRQLGPG